MATPKEAAEARLRGAHDRLVRKRMGRPLHLSDAALDSAVLVTEADEATAEAYWDARAPKEARGLLRARVVEPE